MHICTYTDVLNFSLILISIASLAVFHMVRPPYPMTCRHRSSFSIRHGAEVGTICFRAKQLPSSPSTFNRARNTELKVPNGRGEGKD